MSQIAGFGLCVANGGLCNNLPAVEAVRVTSGAVMMDESTTAYAQIESRPYDLVLRERKAVAIGRCVQE